MPSLQRLMMKPAQLRLLRAIADHGKLQAAADACAMTQPAASRMLAGIEAQIGTPIFLRQPTGMEPTEIGRSVLRRARVILREMASMGAEVDALRGGLAGSVSLGAVTGPAVSHVVAAVREVKALAPRAEINVDVMPSRELLGQLAAGEMDFVLGRILPEFDSRDFDIVPLRDEKVSFVVRADHPLARSPSVTLTELAESEWIMQQRGSPIREATIAAFGSVGLPEPGNILNSPSLLFTIAYLAQGDAIAPLSDEVADLLIGPPVMARMARLKVARELRVSPYYLLSLRRRPLSALALRLREALLHHAAGDTTRTWSSTHR